MAGATDAGLRELARRLAARVSLQLVRTGEARRRGVGRLRRGRWQPGGDVDVEARLDVVLAARAGGMAPPLDELWAQTWGRPGLAVSLVVDRSGSMGGERIASAALAAAAVAHRAPDDYSVLAFADEVLVLKSQDADRPVELVVDDLLALRGRGTTDLALALRAAGEQLARSPAGRRLTVLLSDCRRTRGADPLPVARALGELYVVAPAGDDVDALTLARAAGGRCVPLSGPAGIPAALAGLAG